MYVLDKNKSPRKLKRVKKKENTGMRREIFGVILLCTGLLIFLALFFENSIGVFGEVTRGIFLGLMGIPAYIMPFSFMIYAVFMIFKKDNPEFRFRFYSLLILIVLLSSVFHVISFDSERLINIWRFERVLKFYEDGMNKVGGGAFGGILGDPLIKVFGVAGALIILFSMTVINSIFLTNLSLAQAIKRAGYYIVCVLKSIKGLTNKNKKKGARIIKTSNDDTALNNINRFEEQTKEAESQAEPEVNIYHQGRKTGHQTNKKEDISETISKAFVENKNAQYVFPPLNLLGKGSEEVLDSKAIRESALKGAKKLEATLKSFGISARVINISRGPAVTRYELQPGAGVKVSRIVSLTDDISLNLATSGIRIEAPIPGKAAIGIEVANNEITPVLIRDIIESDTFRRNTSKLAFSLGKDISGEIVIADIEKMPHLLVAGATGSGKSVCINSFIISLLYKTTPEEVKLLMIDPKVVELGVYNGIPHLLIPVVTEPQKAAGALNWAVQEMINRYKLFAEKGVRDLGRYNEIIAKEGENPIPRVVIIIDELSDLMMVAPNEVEDSICRLAQMARAAGMHLVIATQRPSVDVITGVIKANIPSRISFSVSSQVDSRTILDMAGAEKLLGKGDMLFCPVGSSKPVRVKGAYISDEEVERVVDFIKKDVENDYDEEIIEEINNTSKGRQKNVNDEKDELLPDAISIVVDAGQASVSLLQRKLKIGYSRAARIMDQMEERRVVSAQDGSKPRQVFLSRQQWQEMSFSEDMRENEQG